MLSLFRISYSYSLKYSGLIINPLNKEKEEMSNCGEKQINEIVREEVLPLVTFLGMRERGRVQKYSYCSSHAFRAFSIAV